MVILHQLLMETIVLQDLDKDILDVLSFALVQAGYIVHVTYVLDEHILESIADVVPHIVLIDYKLSGKKAIECCQWILSLYPNLPGIAMNCNSNIKDRYQAGGFDCYLDKPFDIEAMYLLIRKFVSYVSNNKVKSNKASFDSI